MKYIKYLNILLSVFVITMLSCEKTYLDESRITYFVDITMHGDELIYHPLGTEFVDPGVTVTENDVEIEPEIVSDVDISTAHKYTIEYTGTNSDGYANTVTRQVNVYDPDATGDLSGDYTGDVIRNGSESYNGITVTLTKYEDIPGTYIISDWISGFYAEGRGYGDDYMFVGIIHITSDNQVVEFDMSNPWGDPFDEVVGTYDPATQTISYSAFWLDGTYEFVVNLVK